MRAVVFIMLTIPYVSLAQRVDTLQHDVGKGGGFRRIRQLDEAGRIRKVWFTNWKKDGTYTSEYTEYDSKDKRVSKIDSTFARRGQLIGLQRYIGDSIESEKMEFSQQGELTKKFVSLWIDRKYIVYRKFKNGSWNYSALLDGDPPKAVHATESDFVRAEEIFAQKYELTSQSDEPSPSDISEPISVTIAEFSGSNIQHTRPFTASSPWEVHWDAKGDFFSIHLYSAEGTMVTILANQSGPGKGSSYHPKTGRFYFTVNALGNWTIRVIKSE